MTMTNNYYEFTPIFIAGTVARSDAVNVQFAAIQAAFDLMPAVTASIPTGRATFAGLSTGTGNAYEVTMPNTRVTNTAGDEVVFIADRTNTGAATLNVDGIGAVSLRQGDGSVLVAGDLKEDLIYEARYDATNNRFQLMGLSVNDSADSAANAAAAAASAAAAAVSEANAATSEANAAASEANAATSESNAATSESNAATSETNAAASAAAAAAANYGLIPTYKTASYTVVNKEFVIINSGGTARTITLPASISAGHHVAIHHFNTSGTEVVVTIARNGHTIRYKGTDTGDDVTLADGQTIDLVATSSSTMEIV